MLVLQKKITLSCAPVVAFDVFTREMPKWWPMEAQSISADTGNLPAKLVVERKKDGQILEVDKLGNAHLWGSFQDYDLPYRVNIAWHIGESAQNATSIEVVFGMETNGTTSVVLSHSGWEKFGDAADALMAAYDLGWDVVFAECYRTACVSASKVVEPINLKERQKIRSRKKHHRAIFGSRHNAVHATQ